MNTWRWLMCLYNNCSTSSSTLSAISTCYTPYNNVHCMFFSLYSFIYAYGWFLQEEMKNEESHNHRMDQPDKTDHSLIVIKGYWRISEIKGVCYLVLGVWREKGGSWISRVYGRESWWCCRRTQWHWGYHIIMMMMMMEFPWPVWESR